MDKKEDTFADTYSNPLNSLDELLERDKQREKDGFKRKIKLGKIIKPGKKNTFVIVPTTIEEKFYHDTRPPKKDSDPFEEKKEGSQTTGKAEGEEGDVIGKTPIDQSAGEGEKNAGAGGGSNHDIESNAYDLGKILTEKFKLPNLKDKGKKKSLTKFTLDLTNLNRGSGQVLDKKRTLKQIVKTNIALKRIDTTKNNYDNLIINPRDYIYRTLSRERDYESQAIVFFIRDYSGSMYGKATEVACTTHLMIFSWLMYQFQERVESRFILHDMEAKEVPDFNTYYNSQVQGGTCVKSSFDLVNQIVEKENLAKDNNIYIFYAGDGDDWQPYVDELGKHIDKSLEYANRIGFTVILGDSTTIDPSLATYIKEHGWLKKKKDLMRLDLINKRVGENRIISGIKDLVSED